MPEITIYKLDESHNAIEFEFLDPQGEFQDYARGLVADLPEGYQLTVVPGRSKMKRPTLTLMPCKVGEVPTPPGDSGSTYKPMKPNQPAEALEVPEVVKKANDAALETLAGKNFVEINDNWKKMSRARKEMVVARALKKVNSSPGGVSRAPA